MISMFSTEMNNPMIDFDKRHSETIPLTRGLSEAGGVSVMYVRDGVIHYERAGDSKIGQKYAEAVGVQK